MSIVLDGTTGLAGAATGALNGALGGTTPSTVVATTVTATSGIVGTTTNNNAGTGYVGEYVSSNVNAGSPTGATNNTVGNVTSISLTAGDWDVSGSVVFFPNGTTTLSTVSCTISTTSATMAGIGSADQAIGVQQWNPNLASVATYYPVVSAPIKRISIASTTTVYLCYRATFAVSTLGVGGQLSARRIR